MGNSTVKHFKSSFVNKLNSLVEKGRSAHQFVLKRQIAPIQLNFVTIDNI